MSVFQGILLGILQGLAEFLPISSSGHLALAQSLFGLEEVPLLYDVFLHLATLFAVCLYFRRKIWELLKCLGRWISRRPRPAESETDDLLCGTDERGRKAIIAIILSTFVTGIIGIFTSKLIPDLPVRAICLGFICTACLLISSAIIEKRRSDKVAAAVPAEASARGASSSVGAAGTANPAEAVTPKAISIWQALFIGLMQGFGTLPGISRSGSTIAGALYAGVDRKFAGDYSFIISIPAILGAFILELKDLGEVSSSIGIAPVLAGCAAAFAVGYISLTLLMKVIRNGKLYWFAAYLIPIGILGFSFL